MDHPLYGGELMSRMIKNPKGRERRIEKRKESNKIAKKQEEAKESRHEQKAADIKSRKNKIEKKENQAIAKQNRQQDKKDEIASRARKVDARDSLAKEIKSAGKDGKLTSKEITNISSNTRLNLDKITSALGKSNASYNKENLNYNINRGSLTPEQFNANKNDLLRQYTNQSIKKDPYTGKVMSGPLRRTAEKLSGYGVTDFQPKPIQLELAKLAQSGKGLNNKTLQELGSKFDIRPQALVNAANMFGLTGQGNTPLTADNVRSQFRTARAVETEAPVEQVDTAENAVLDLEKMMEGFASIVKQGFQNQPDIGSLMEKLTNSQNAMFGNMVNNNRIQQSQMNPIRMAPVLGVRSAGTQNYGVNNATNTFGRTGDRVQGIKNNSLNLT